MSEAVYGCYLSSNADGSNYDYTFYADALPNGFAAVGVRQKNQPPTTIYEVALDVESLEKLGKLYIDLARQMRHGQRK